jgi:hypothetical protein
MVLFHGHPATATTNKFHRGQFILTYMGLINTRGTAEAAFFFITARIAQMPRLFGYRTAAFTCIRHIDSPFLLRVM